MRVGFNGLFLGRPMTGTGQYSLHLAACLARVAPDVCLALQRHEERHSLDKLLWEQALWQRQALRDGCQVLHNPYFAAPLLRRRPCLVTVHDLIPLVLPAYRASRLVRWYMALVSRAVRAGASVSADSRHSADDVRRLLGLAADRVHVVYLGVEPRFRPPGQAEVEDLRVRYRLPERFLLYLGGYDARKNLPRLLGAYARPNNLPPLVLAGRLPQPGPLFPDVLAIVRQLGLEGRVIALGPFPEEDKALLYGAASAFVFPSLYEGFGLDPLEALACGTPVACSSASSLPEVVGEAALLFDPRDEAALAAALGRICGDEDLRTELRKRGPEQARTFNWERTARETADIYRRLAAGQ